MPKLNQKYKFQHFNIVKAKTIKIKPIDLLYHSIVKSVYLIFSKNLILCYLSIYFILIIEV